MIDISKYAAFHQASINQFRKDNLESIRKAYLKLDKIIATLKEIPSVKRVILFGSLKNKTYTVDKSDIDIAVDGLPPSEYFSICRKIENKTGLNIDLVDLTKSNKTLYNIITKTGQIIYERQK